MMNGFSGIFMVASVSAVPVTRKTGREDGGASYVGSARQNGEGIFASILADKVDEQKEAGMDCSTMTYGRDRQLQTFLYRTREYRY